MLDTTKKDTVAISLTPSRHILTAADILDKVVKVTFGPKGRKVMLDRPHTPILCDDGATVAREIDLTGFDDVVIQLLKQCSLNVEERVGDGTTSTILIASEIIRSAIKLITSGYNIVDIANGIDIASKECIKYCRKKSKKIKKTEDIYAVGMVASGDENIAKMVGDAAVLAGKYGILFPDKSNSKDYIETEDGISINVRPVNNFFFDFDKKVFFEIQNPLIIITDASITSFSVIKKILIAANQKSQLIILIAPQFNRDIIKVIADNYMANCSNNASGGKVIPLSLEEGFSLQELSMLLGVSVISFEQGMSLENITTDSIETAKGVLVIRKDGVQYFPDYEQSQYIFSYIDKILLKKKFSYDYEKERLKEKIARMTCGLIAIKLGAKNVAELGFRASKTSDAINSVSLAISGGILPGCGKAYINCFNHLKVFIKNTSLNNDTKLGIKCVINGLLAPTRRLAEVSDFSGDIAVREMVKSSEWEGFDAMAEDFSIIDLNKAKIFDSTEVVVAVIDAACNIAKQFVLTGAIIKKKKGKKNGR